ncbi:NAD(P)H-hydrate dehydratase [Candidatus Bathyarchaeota archaeon A05DMB-2]|jgi:NAD(P)H-hydrate epimerase|nr:NAD(P)H-hydrate dehydratase [Candidatus Bathyarchaeota archaeon A05DMB-2]
MPTKKKNAQYITSREMRAAEANAEYFGVTLLQLMENAGRNIAAEVAARFPQDTKIAVFCGLGGNGGDGFVAARHLLSMGYTVSVILAGKGKDITHDAAARNWCALQFLREKIPIYEVPDSSLMPTVKADVIVDALLGTGTKGRLKPPISMFVERINSLNAFKIAVDVPTGVDSDTGEVLGEAVKADVTLTFYKAKAGLENAKKYTGELLVKGIGLPEEFEAYAGPGDVLLVTKARPLSAHKGDFGRLLVVGGSEVFSGAPTLVALAALRTGVDITYLAAPEKTARAISSISPDLITVKLDGDHLNPGNVAELEAYVNAVDAVVLGPGLGLHPKTKEFVKAFVSTVEDNGKPLLLDADGLKAFAENKRPLKVPVVFTPHAGEYAILAGRQISERLEDRVAEVQKTAGKLGAVILLKGQVDVVCNGERFKLNFTGNPGMTVGGTGDVLSGIVGAFLAQKTDAFEAAVAAAFVNGAAGDFAAEKIGYHLVATDLLKWIPYVLNDPMCHLKVRKTGGKTS